MALTAIGTVFICGGIQGYQAGVGDLRGHGLLEWPMRVLLVIGGIVLATPGGGIMPFSNATMEIAAVAILAPTVIVACCSCRRARRLPDGSAGRDGKRSHHRRHNERRVSARQGS